MLAEKPMTFDRVARLALGAAVVWGLVVTLNYLSEALAPFVLAMVLAYFIDPLVRLVQRAVSNRVAAVLISLCALAGIASVALWLVLPAVGSEIMHMVRLVRDLITDSPLAQRAAQRLPPDIWQFLRDMSNSAEVKDFMTNSGLSGLLQSAAKKLLPSLWVAILQVRDALFWILGGFVLLLYLVFVLLDFQRLRNGIFRLIPLRYRPAGEQFFEEFMEGLNRYFRAQALVAFCVGVLFSIGFSLIGLPMAILMGMGTGLLNMVPYLQLLAIPPALCLGVVHALETGADFFTVLAMVAAVFAVVQVIQDGFLVPRIMGGAMGLSPAVMLLSLSVWGKLLGFLGLVIALPLTILVHSWYKRLVTREEEDEDEEDSPPLDPGEQKEDFMNGA